MESTLDDQNFGTTPATFVFEKLFERLSPRSGDAVTRSSGPFVPQIGASWRGGGPVLIVLNGALATRSGGSQPKLATMLSEHLTVVRYDRRGRGDSGDTQPYAVDREIEDIEALIEEAGGSAFL